MIMESNLKWDKSPGLIAEGMKQVSALANRINLDTWTWDMVKRFHIHGFDRSSLGQIKLGGILRVRHTCPTLVKNCCLLDRR
jgi:hypothetical protein